MIRTVSSTLELLYWDVPAKVQILRVNELEKAEWHTHHCKLGWYAGGVLQASGNEHTINSIDVCEYSKDKKLMIVSGSDGEVKMFHFPVLDAQASARVTVGHAPLVTKTRFSSDAQRVLTLGGKDQSIMQWRILVTTLHPLVKLLASKADPEFPLYEVPGNNLMKAMMVQRASRMVQHTEPPTSHLELDFVHGYGGHNNNANLFVVESGELIYNAGALVVVYDSLARSQFFFREHQNDIMAMALHPDGYHVASADAGISPAICVWHVEAMVCLARLDGGGLPGVGGFESGVPALAFSPDGTRIAAVGADKEHTLYLLDWRAKKTIAAGKCGGGRVLACAFLPYEKDMLVTVGVRHVKFWTNAGTKMIGRDGVFGKHVLKCTMQCVDVNPANFVGHAGQKSVTLTGGMDGRLYAFGTIMSDGEWRPEALNSSIIAHVGPVFDIRHDHITLLIVSCGSDGYIKTWKLKTSLNPKDKSKTELDLTVHETFLVSQIVTDLPVHVSEATFGKSVLFSKKKTGPVLLIGTNTDEIFECGINTEFKIVKDPKTHLLLPANLLIAGQGGSMTDLVIHPTRPLSFSVGTDSVVKMWDTEHNCLVAAKGFEVPVVTVDFLEDGNRLVVGASDGTIILLTSFWDIGEDGKGPGKWVFEELARTDAKGQVTIIRFSGDVLGERFIAAGRSDGLIDFFSAKGNDLDYVESTRASDGKGRGIDFMC